MIGELLAGYQLVRKLGEGDTGETYEAVHAASGQAAAAKILFPQLCADRGALDRFFAEVRATNQVNHVGIVDVYDVGVHASGRAFVVMELLHGKTLTDALLELGQVSDTASLADIAWQLATLLDAVHATKVVHGALKPDAVYLTFPPAQAPRPQVRLLEFGMSKFSLNVRHSQTGSLLGAPLYMSPEASRGLGNADHRADIYSLGCILFEMACGRPPFVREGKGELIIAHASETPPSVASLEPAVPRAIDNLIGRMLTKNPATRPQSMAEVAAVFEKFLACPAPAAALAPAASPMAAPVDSAVALTAPAPAATVILAAAAAPPSAPSQTIPAEAPAVERGSTPRQLDSTALLPPEADAAGSRPPGALAQAPVVATWQARLHQRTALLPPSASGSPAPPGGFTAAARPSELAGREPGARRRGRAADQPRRAAPVNLPLVVATAAALLVLGALAILLTRPKPPKPVVEKTPLYVPAAREPTPEPAPEPRPAPNSPAPSTGAASSAVAAPGPSARPAATPPPASVVPAVPAHPRRRRPVPYW